MKVDDGTLIVVNEETRTLLQKAVVYRDVDAVRNLLDKGADVNAPNEIGRTPLTFAALNLYDDVVTLLIDRGADLEAEDQVGCTPLWSATNRTKDDGTVIRLLREAGADPHHVSFFGSSPFSLAFEYGKHSLQFRRPTLKYFKDLPNTFAGPDNSICPRDLVVMRPHHVRITGETRRCFDCGLTIRLGYLDEP